MNHPVRVRFAPSPTGHLHIGGLRTALFNLLFARHYGGSFLIRIEDTDIQRSRPEFTRSQLDSLAWCGIAADEPLVYQSAQHELYHHVIDRLIMSRGAYRCFCTQEEVRARVRGLVQKVEDEDYLFYDGYCRDRDPSFSDQSRPFVVRLRIDRQRTTIQVEDLIRGSLTFSLDTIDDFVLLRSNGMAMYNCAVVIDDATMQITHVIRGDDHIINMPKQVLLYQAAGFPLPFFAHIPLILGKDGKKLSKRDAATDMHEYRKAGILADALCNYLVRLGWAHGDREIIERNELIELFTLEQVGIKSALFDREKLLWLNSVYIKKSTPQFLLECIEKDINPSFKDIFSGWSASQLCHAIALYQPRVKTLVELCDLVSSLVQDPAMTSQERLITPEQRIALLFLIEILEKTERWEASHLKDIMDEVVAVHRLPFSAIALPLRKALTGTFSAPGVADLLELCGSRLSLHRLKRFL